MQKMMTVLLAALAVGAGVWTGGWAGLGLAATVIVFWLVLQWGQALRVLNRAAAGPLGQVPSAVMLHSRLRLGLSLSQVLQLTQSLGARLDVAEPSPHQADECFEWRDASAARVQVWLRQGRLVHWDLLRQPELLASAADV